MKVRMSIGGLLVRLSSWYRGIMQRGLVWLMGVNALVCGVEIVASAAFAYIPPLLLKAGYTETLTNIILGISPVIDLMTVPTLAEWSDRCSASIGRRRPFIIAFSTILIASLILIPYGSIISSFITDAEGTSYANMVILALGSIMLDYSYQALFNPCESLLSDFMVTSTDAEQSRGFTVYSAAMSMGSIVGYLIVAIDWASVGLFLGSQEQTAFAVILFTLLPCLFATLFVAKETPLKSIEDSSTTLTRPDDFGYESDTSDDSEVIPKPLTTFEMLRIKYTRISYQITVVPRMKMQRFIKSVFRVVETFIYVSLWVPCQLINLPCRTWHRIKDAPVVLQRLFLTEFFGWMSLLCHNLFFTNFVGQYVYGGLPDAPEHTELAILYDEGVRMGSWCLFLHSLIACVYAFMFQQPLIKLFGPRNVFIGGIAVFTVATFATLVSPSIHFTVIVTTLSGVGFAAITSTPNTLVILYNTNKQMWMSDRESPQDLAPSTPASGSSSSSHQSIAADIAILDTAFYLSQIVLSIFMGPVAEASGSSMSYMVVAAVAGLFAVYCASRVVFTEKDLRQMKAGKF